MVEATAAILLAWVPAPAASCHGPVTLGRLWKMKLIMVPASRDLLWGRGKVKSLEGLARSTHWIRGGRASSVRLVAGLVVRARPCHRHVGPCSSSSAPAPVFLKTSLEVPVSSGSF